MGDVKIKTKETKNSKSFSARFCAVQALYQMTQNKQPMNMIVEEYLQHRAGQDMDGVGLPAPDGSLFKQILLGVDERYIEFKTIVEGNIERDGLQYFDPLLLSILLCGCYELLCKSDIDAPIIINDYIDIAHSFYDQGESKIANAVLDKIAKLFR